MPVEIVVPQLGESVVEATLARWLKQPGDVVQPGEPVAALETDKVDLDVSVEQGGVLSQVNRAEGDTVTVGEVLGIITENGAAAEAAPEGSTGASVPTPDQSPAAAVPPAETPAPAPAPPPAAPPQPSPPAVENAQATPLARSIAEKNQVDLDSVPGTGPHGRVTREDVADYIERMASVPATEIEIAESAADLPQALQPAEPPVPRHTQTPIPGAAAPPPAPPAPTPAAPAAVSGRPEERQRMSRRRQTIATRLVEAQRTAAMLTTFNEADMSAIMAIRKRRRDAFKEKHGVGLGFMSFFTKAVVGALKAFPMLNAEIQGEEVVVKRYYDIGVAVSTDEGLVVPVVRNADQLTFAGIEAAIADLAGRARDGKLTLPELYGGTFTITNGGIFGSLLSTPILNAPQVGILGMHKIQERPVVVDGEIVVRPMMYLALSYDHRLIDGAEAVRFLVRIKELLEDPESLLIEG